MNIQNVKATLNVMHRIKLLDMCDFQQKGFLGPGELTILATTEEELHACGNTACIAGHIAVSPEWAAFGGRFEQGMPMFGEFEEPCEALAVYWGMSATLAASIIYGYSEFFSLKRALGLDLPPWGQLKKEHAVALFEAMLAKPDVVDNISAVTK